MCFSNKEKTTTPPLTHRWEVFSIPDSKCIVKNTVKYQGVNMRRRGSKIGANFKTYPASHSRIFPISFHPFAISTFCSAHQCTLSRDDPSKSQFFSAAQFLCMCPEKIFCVKKGFFPKKTVSTGILGSLNKRVLIA